MKGFEKIGPTKGQSRTVIWTFTAPASGADKYELPVPADALGNSVTWQIRSCSFRASVPSSGTTTLQVQVSSGTGVFSASNLLSSALSLTGSALYEISSTGFVQATLLTGNKVRINFSAVDATHDGIVVSLELGLVT